MTNKEVEDDPAYDPRLAAFLAVHLVGQILDDAYVIVSSALETNTTEPWHYQSKVTEVHLGESDDDDEVSIKADSDCVNENKMELVANLVATSTPQKVTDDLLRCKPESNFIGQGDEIEMRHQNELATSKFINHLFDMSEVETVIVSEDTTLIQNNLVPNKLLTQAMSNIMDSYINTALGIALKRQSQTVEASMFIERPVSPEYSEYSFLSDAFDTDISGNIAFYMQDSDAAIGTTSDHYDYTSVVPGVQITEIHDEECEQCTSNNNIARLENAYLSLNRDYEQCSEEEGNLILNDPRGMTLQEVQLLTANTSEENICVHDVSQSEANEGKSNELKGTSAVSAASKKTLASRCRSQGARLLACIRGWWRRRTPGKRKENQYRVSGGARGLCPLSPAARCRATSLIDQRVLRSPSPSRQVMWKFNTVNEALVNSSHWKDYSFDVQPDECGEY